MTEAARRSLQARWGIKAYDNFGSVARRALRLSSVLSNSAITSTKTPISSRGGRDTLIPMEAKRDGVVVVTSLFKEAAPVIRYNLEDISSISDDPCPCGRTFRRLMKIKGRASEMLKVRGVPFYPTAVEGVLESFPRADPRVPADT